jgi:hypothetical protein
MSFRIFPRLRLQLAKAAWHAGAPKNHQAKGSVTVISLSNNQTSSFHCLIIRVMTNVNIFFINYFLKNSEEFIKLAKETNTVSLWWALDQPPSRVGYENRNTGQKISVVDKFYTMP